MLCKLKSLALLDLLTELFSHELALNKFFVGAVAGNQLVVVALFDDLALAQDYNLVGIADRRQPVCDHDACLLLG